MTRNYDSTFLLAALVVLLVCTAAELVMPRTHAAPVPEPTTQTIAAQDRPIALFTEKDRTLTISAHAPGDLLVCFSDDNHCKLVRDWRAR